LEEGTTSRSALEVADTLALLGANYVTRTMPDASSVTLKVIKRNVSAGFDVLGDLVMNPAFRQAELERLRQSRLGELREALQDSNQVANEVSTLALFGPSNPYGPLSLGTEASVRRISRNDMRSFWSQRFVPTNAALIISGDITRQELQPILDRSFARWKGGSPREIRKERTVTTAANLVIVDKPGAPQTQLRVALAGPSRSTPDYEPLQVMNAILGSMFSSRINLNLREEHGYTYGASSRFTHFRDAGWFSAGSGVRTDVTGPATREMLREIARMAETPVKAEELALAKDYLTGALPGRFEMTDQTVGMLTDVFVYGLGMDYYNTYVAKVNGASIEQIQSVAKKHLTVQKPIVVAVGDRAKIEPALKELGIGGIEYRDVNGQVVK
jgi:zinc protease